MLSVLVLGTLCLRSGPRRGKEEEDGMIMGERECSLVPCYRLWFPKSSENSAVAGVGVAIESHSAVVVTVAASLMP